MSNHFSSFLPPSAFGILDLFSIFVDLPWLLHLKGHINSYLKLAFFTLYMYNFTGFQRFSVSQLLQALILSMTDNSPLVVVQLSTAPQWAPKSC